MAGVRYEEKYGFVDAESGEALKAKYIGASPTKYRVWDNQGQQWEGTAETAPAQPRQAPLDPNAGVAEQMRWYYLQRVTQQYVPAGLPSTTGTYLQNPLYQVKPSWTFKLIPRAPTPAVHGDDKEILNDFLVGCDPELAVIRDGAPIRVDTIVPHAGEIGYDHNGHVLEIRPRPYRGTYALVKEIRKLVTSSRMQEMFPGCQLRAGAHLQGNGRELTLGGHIHLGVSPYRKGVVQALDRLTRAFEKLEILPHEECEARRNLSEYGRLGDIRHYEESDGNVHLEYRTMPSWLYSPKVAFTCLTAAKLAALDPDGALAQLKPKSMGGKGLSAWFEGFRNKDENATRLLDAVIAKEGLKGIQGNPDADVIKAWGGESLGF